MSKALSDLLAVYKITCVRVSSLSQRHGSAHCNVTEAVQSVGSE